MSSVNVIESLLVSNVPNVSIQSHTETQDNNLNDLSLKALFPLALHIDSAEDIPSIPGTSSIITTTITAIELETDSTNSKSNKKTSKKRCGIRKQGDTKNAKKSKELPSKSLDINDLTPVPSNWVPPRKYYEEDGDFPDGTGPEV